MFVPRLEGCGQLLRRADMPDDMLHTLAQALQHLLIALLVLAAMGVQLRIINGDDLQAGSPEVAQALAGSDVLVSIQLCTADLGGLYTAYSALFMSILGLSAWQGRAADCKEFQNSATAGDLRQNPQASSTSMVMPLSDRAPLTFSRANSRASSMLDSGSRKLLISRMRLRVFFLLRTSERSLSSPLATVTALRKSL